MSDALFTVENGTASVRQQGDTSAAQLSQPSRPHGAKIRDKVKHVEKYFGKIFKALLQQLRSNNGAHHH